MNPDSIIVATNNVANTGAPSTQEMKDMARRRYQRGSVFPRGKRIRVWVGRWREDIIDKDGNRRRMDRKEVLGTMKDFPTKKLAMRELEVRLAPINSTNYRAMRTATFSEFVRTWRENALSQHKPSTQASINSQIDCWLDPFFGEFHMRDIHGQTVQMFVNHCKSEPNNCAPKTVKNMVLTLKMMWKSAKGWGYGVSDPFEGLVLPKNPRRAAFFFTVDEAVKIITKCGELEEKTFYWIAAETGMRAGEICGLRDSDVYLDNCIIAVRQSAWRTTLQAPKNDNAVRWVPISTRLAEHLRSYLQTWRPNERRLLFVNSIGGPWSPCNLIREHLKPLLSRLEIKHPKRCGIHAFRHTSSSMLDRINAPMKIRQERIGHSLGSKITVDLYTHAVPEDHRKVAAELGDLLCPSVATFLETKTEADVLQ